MNVNSFNRVCIAGFKKSGVALADLLLALGKKARVSESRPQANFDRELIAGFIKRGLEFEFGANSKEFIKGSDLIVLSPGVDAFNSRIVGFAREMKIPYVGEIEFSSWLTEAKIVAITGTNGKTTTTHLIYQVLKKLNRPVFVGGNIGTPFSSFVLNTRKNDIVILEVSSFQLDTIIEFHPYVAAILNIEPDHLDRYADFSGYFKAKLNIFRNQSPQDWAIINKNINFSRQAKDNLKARLVYFSDEFANENFSCIYRIAQIFGLSKADCLSVFSQFCGLRHRMQLVRKIGKFSFINDSKATNPASTVWALKSTRGPVVLLAGGKDKGLSYSAISPFLRRVKKINLFGEAAEKIKQDLSGRPGISIYSSLEEAVLASRAQAPDGATVLFSPMCSSFDMFSDYKERGEKFIEIVNNLPV